MMNQSFDFNMLEWPTLKAYIKEYFCPADFKQWAHDSLAACTQTNSVSAYIDAMKNCAQCLPDVTDDELLDRFVWGLQSTA